MTEDALIQRLNEIVMEEKCLVQHNFEDDDDIKLVSFQDKLLASISGITQSFKKEIPVWKQQFPYLFELLDQRASIIFKSPFETYKKNKSQGR